MIDKLTRVLPVLHGLGGMSILLALPSRCFETWSAR